MTRELAKFDEEAARLVDVAIGELRGLSFLKAQSLPGVTESDLNIGGREGTITTFRYIDAIAVEGKVLVVVLAATPTWMGMASHHVERGLVFSEHFPAREATQVELENSGG